MKPTSDILATEAQAEASESPVPDLDSSELYTNRELSWLGFNERVLELAEDERTIFFYVS